MLFISDNCYNIMRLPSAQTTLKTRMTMAKLRKINIEMPMTSLFFKIHLHHGCTVPLKSCMFESN